jgi:hypothetical protein
MSIGQSASMKIRMKDKHYYGVSKSNNYTDATPMPGCLHYDERVAAHAELSDFRDDKQALIDKKKEIVDRLGLKSGRSAKDLLSLHLSHGDIIIMHGEALQTYFEVCCSFRSFFLCTDHLQHAIAPEGDLRFALTCRYIDQGSLQESRRPEYEVKAADPYQPTWMAL